MPEVKYKNIIYFVSFFLFSGYYAGLALILSFGYINYSRFYSVPIRLTIAVLMVYVIVNNLSKKSDYYKPAVFFAFSAFYILKIIYSQSIAVSSNEFSISWYEFIFYFLCFSVFPFYTFNSLNYRNYHDIILDAILLSGFILGIISLFLYKDIFLSGVGRIGVRTSQSSDVQTTLSPLALSYSGALNIVLCLYKIIYNKNSRTKLLYLFSIICLSFIMFYLGASRGSVIALIGCFPFFLVHGNLKQKRTMVILLIIMIPIMLWGALTSGSDVFTRVGDISSDIRTGSSSTVRLDIWKAALTEFVQNPILGGKIEVNATKAHNIFIEVLMATGIVGFSMFMYLFITSLKSGIKLINYDKIYLIPILLFINGAIQYCFSGALHGAILLFAPMGMIFSITIYRRKRKYLPFKMLSVKSP